MKTSDEFNKEIEEMWLHKIKFSPGRLSELIHPGSMISIVDDISTLNEHYQRKILISVVGIDPLELRVVAFTRNKRE